MGIKTNTLETTSTASDSIKTAGGATIAKRILCDDTTEATTTTDGAQAIAGGLSVAKNIVSGGDIVLKNNLTFTPTVGASGRGYHETFGGSIPDDNVTSYTTKSNHFHWWVMTDNAQHGYGTCFNGTLVKTGGTANLTIGSGVLTGTSGTDGHITISFDSGKMYVENRHGNPRTCVVNTLGASTS